MKFSELNHLASAVRTVATLEHISLKDSSANRGDGRHQGTLKYEVQQAAAINRSGETLHIRIRYTIVAAPVTDPGATSEEEAPPAWKIRATWVARYKLPEAAELSNEQIYAFAITTVGSIIYPFARQHVHWLSGAMGYTALMLSEINPLLGSNDTDEINIEFITPSDSAKSS